MLGAANAQPRKARRLGQPAQRICHFATVNVPEMNVFVQPPSRPLRQEADHAQSTVTSTGTPAESLPEAVPFTFTSDCLVKSAVPLKLVKSEVVSSWSCEVCCVL